MLGRQPIAAALVDALGRVVRSQELPAGAAAHALPLAGAAPGAYSLRLTTELGAVVQKLVVEQPLPRAAANLAAWEILGYLHFLFNYDAHLDQPQYE